MDNPILKELFQPKLQLSTQILGTTLTNAGNYGILSKFESNQHCSSKLPRSSSHCSSTSTSFAALRPKIFTGSVAPPSDQQNPIEPSPIRDLQKSHAPTRAFAVAGPPTDICLRSSEIRPTEPDGLAPASSEVPSPPFFVVSLAADCLPLASLPSFVSKDVCRRLVYLQNAGPPSLPPFLPAGHLATTPDGQLLQASDLHPPLSCAKSRLILPPTVVTNAPAALSLPWSHRSRLILQRPKRQPPAAGHPFHSGRSFNS